ncbi:hypothetical protein [Ideonella sp.]|uniref:hypothetical protein n=1 Tax=Ideonella sp. TaxID=1929293 RepID=UPI0035B3D7D0
MTVSPDLFATFSSLVDHHDVDPPAAADRLREMVNDNLIEESDHRRLAWLVNHVIGETLGQWTLSSDTLDRGLGASREPACVVQRATAALMCGQAAHSLSLLPRLAELAQCTYPMAAAVVYLSALQYSKDASVDVKVPAFNGLLEMLDAPVVSMGRVAPIVAAALNNVTSSLMDAPDDNVGGDPSAYRRALVKGAERCRAVWTEVGNWINQERAHYLVALCANRLLDHGAAERAALAGIETITNNGTEDVDRAFLLLELARARRGLGRQAEADGARQQAMALAASFDKEVRATFDARALT